MAIDRIQLRPSTIQKICLCLLTPCLARPLRGISWDCPGNYHLPAEGGLRGAQGRLSEGRGFAQPPLKPPLREGSWTLPALHPRSGLVLPTTPATPLVLVNFVALWPCSCQQGSKNVVRSQPQTNRAPPA